MSFSSAAIRRIDHVVSREEAEHTGTTDDWSSFVCILCNFLITALSPFYYKIFFKQRKSGAFKHNQIVMNQIAFVSLHPSIFCILNTIIFLLECATDINYEPYPKLKMVTSLKVKIMLIVRLLCFKLSDGNSRIFQWYIVFLGSLLNCFIILLAIQRFVFVFLPMKFHFLVKHKALGIYIIIIWILSLLHRLVFSVLLIGYTQKRCMDHMEKYHNKLSYYTFGSLIFVTLIYLALFVNFYKTSRMKRNSRPEKALLYEGIPLLLINTFILYYIRYKSAEGGLITHYFNYEMRRVVISTALVQFTYIFTFDKIVKFFSTDLRVIIDRPSIVAAVGPSPVSVFYELNHM